MKKMKKKHFVFSSVLLTILFISCSVREPDSDLDPTPTPNPIPSISVAEQFENNMAGNYSSVVESLPVGSGSYSLVANYNISLSKDPLTITLKTTDGTLLPFVLDTVTTPKEAIFIYNGTSVTVTIDENKNILINGIIVANHDNIASSFASNIKGGYVATAEGITRSARSLGFVLDEHTHSPISEDLHITLIKDNGDQAKLLYVQATDASNATYLLEGTAQDNIPVEILSNGDLSINGTTLLRKIQDDASEFAQNITKTFVTGIEGEDTVTLANKTFTITRYQALQINLNEDIVIATDQGDLTLSFDRAIHADEGIFNYTHDGVTDKENIIIQNGTVLLLENVEIANYINNSTFTDSIKGEYVATGASALGLTLDEHTYSSIGTDLDITLIKDNGDQAKLLYVQAIDTDNAIYLLEGTAQDNILVEVLSNGDLSINGTTLLRRIKDNASQFAQNITKTFVTGISGEDTVTLANKTFTITRYQALQINLNEDIVLATDKGDLTLSFDRAVNANEGIFNYTHDGVTDKENIIIQNGTVLLLENVEIANQINGNVVSAFTDNIKGGYVATAVSVLGFTLDEHTHSPIGADLNITLIKDNGDQAKLVYVQAIDADNAIYLLEGTTQNDILVEVLSSGDLAIDGTTLLRRIKDNASQFAQNITKTFVTGISGEDTVTLGNKTFVIDKNQVIQVNLNNNIVLATDQGNLTLSFDRAVNANEGIFNYSYNGVTDKENIIIQNGTALLLENVEIANYINESTFTTIIQGGYVATGASVLGFTLDEHTHSPIGADLNITLIKDNGAQAKLVYVHATGASNAIYLLEGTTQNDILVEILSSGDLAIDGTTILRKIQDNASQFAQNITKTFGTGIIGASTVTLANKTFVIDKHQVFQVNLNNNIILATDQGNLTLSFDRAVNANEGIFNYSYNGVTDKENIIIQNGTILLLENVEIAWVADSAAENLFKANIIKHQPFITVKATVNIGGEQLNLQSGKTIRITKESYDIPFKTADGTIVWEFVTAYSARKAVYSYNGNFVIVIVYENSGTIRLGQRTGNNIQLAGNK